MTPLLVLGLMVATWRTTRLLVRDEFPPARAVREWFIATFGVVDPAGNITGGRSSADRGESYPWRPALVVLPLLVAVSAVLRANMGAGLEPLRWALIVALTIGTLIVLATRVGAHALAYLWTCPWCMSIWVAAGLVALAECWTDVPLPWLVGALGAAFTGVMTWVENEHDQRFELRALAIGKEQR